MLMFAAQVALSIWITSSLISLTFYFHMQINKFFKEGKLVTMPIWYFLYANFCPFVHTKKAFIMLNAWTKYLTTERGK